MKRYLQEQLLRDLGRKMVLLSGPRQVGKTFMARDLMKAFKRPQYLNYDNFDDARIVQDRTWAANTDFLVLDEIHKMRDWKNFLNTDFRTSHLTALFLGTPRDAAANFLLLQSTADGAPSISVISCDV